MTPPSLEAAELARNLACRIASSYNLRSRNPGAVNNMTDLLTAALTLARDAGSEAMREAAILATCKACRNELEGEGIRAIPVLVKPGYLPNFGSVEQETYIHYHDGGPACYCAAAAIRALPVGGAPPPAGWTREPIGDLEP